MANIVLLSGGREYLARLLVGIDGPGTLQYHLAHNDHTPTSADASSDYTAAEANYTGYAAKNATGWTDLGDDGTHATVVGDPLAFTCPISLATTDHVYCFYVTLSSTPLVVLWAARLDSAPAPMVDPGDTVVINPKFQVANETV